MPIPPFQLHPKHPRPAQDWVRLSTYQHPPAPDLSWEELDARFREAADVLRRRWDAYNEAHGYDVDYDTLSRDFPHDSPRRGGGASSSSSGED